MARPAIEPATVHFNGGPIDGTGESDRDEDVAENWAACTVCVETRNGERIPHSMKRGVSEVGLEALLDGIDENPPLHGYRAVTAERIDGRLHIYCQYEGTDPGAA